MMKFDITSPISMEDFEIDNSKYIDLCRDVELALKSDIKKNYGSRYPYYDITNVIRCLKRDSSSHNILSLGIHISNLYLNDRVIDKSIFVDEFNKYSKLFRCVGFIADSPDQTNFIMGLL